jgi:hypothetical protein
MIKKCVVYPQEDFLFTILYGDSSRPPKKYIQYPKSKKKNQDTYEIYPTKFASSTQNHKKVIETPNQPIEIKKISNESMFSTSKVKRRPKIVWRLPDGVCRFNQNVKKNCRNIKSEQKISKENYVSSLKSVKEPKFRIKAYRRNLQAQLKILKKLSEHQIYESKRKGSQKKSMFSI